MKNRLILTAFALTALAAAFDTPAQVQASIQKEMNVYCAGMKAKDAAAIEKVIKANFAPEFKDTDMRGQVRDRAGTIKAVRENISMLKTVKTAKLDVGSVKVAGDKATTVEHLTLDATIVNFQDTKKTSTLKVDSTWNGTYVKKNGKWWCILSKATKETVLIDGKKLG